MSLFIDTLRLAGDNGDRSRRGQFDWQIIGEKGLPIRSSCGVEILPTISITEPESYDHIVVVGGLLNAKHGLTSDKEAFLLTAAQRKIPLTALCTGSFLLARHGLLDSYRTCVSWFHIKDFRDIFPHIRAQADTLFAIDRDRATCAGGAGAADLASTFVSNHLGDKAAQKAAKILIFDRIRTGQDVQPGGDLFPNASSRHVKRALLLMESYMQDKMSVFDIACQLGMTRRQLERLFLAEVQMGPKAAYLLLRLRYARTLLRTSDLLLGEVAYRCGFLSAGHFSRVFRQYEGVPPSEARKRDLVFPRA